MHKVIYIVFIEKNVPKFSSTDLKEGCLFNSQELIGSKVHISGIPAVYPWSKVNNVSAPTPNTHTKFMLPGTSERDLVWT